MLPFLDFGLFRLPAYGLLLATALLLGIWMAVKRAPRYGLEPDFVYSTAAMAALAGIIGSKLLDFALHREFYTLKTLITGAGTFLGGFLLAVLAVAIAARRARVSFWRVGDSFAPSLALGVMVVRVGCFAASCDYGKPSELPWAVTFTNPEASSFTGVPLGTPLHPSQLYESALGLVILGTLLAAERRPRPTGFLLLIFGVMYSVGRFLLEFLRGDVDRGFFGPLSTSQWLSLVVLALFVGGYAYARRSEESGNGKKAGEGNQKQRKQARQGK
jgi:phosphatidylglycerol---prolipoprotein diacylglyceryl transferase